MHAAHRDGAESQVRTQPAAAFGSGQRAGQGTPVITATAVQKAVQRGPGGLLATLRQGRAQGWQAELKQCRRDCLRQAGRGPEGKCRGSLGGVHALSPSRRPAGARGQPPHHPSLREFGPVHAMATAPLRNRQVSGVAPSRPGFFVAEQVSKRKFLPQCLQHLRHGAGTHQQRQAARCQIALQPGHAIQQEADMARVALGAAEPLRLNHHQPDGVIEAHGLSQRGMVSHTQVALEPDQRSRATHGNCPKRRHIRPGQRPGWKLSMVKVNRVSDLGTRIGPRQVAPGGAPSAAAADASAGTAGRYAP